HSRNDIGDGAIATKGQTKRVSSGNATPNTTKNGGRWLRAVLKVVADAPHEVQRECVERPTHSFRYERFPVVRSNVVQVPDDLRKFKRNDVARCRVLAQE